MSLCHIIYGRMQLNFEWVKSLSFVVFSIVKKERYKICKYPVFRTTYKLEVKYGNCLFAKSWVSR